MRVLLGISMYFLEIPVFMWLYYRCLEEEEKIWKKGKYVLLFLEIARAAFSFCGFLLQDSLAWPRQLGSMIGIFLMAVFFSMIILWAEKGMDAFVKTTLFLYGFQWITQGLVAAMKEVLGIEKANMELAGSSSLLVALLFVLAIGISFLAAALFLHLNLYRMIPGPAWDIMAELAILLYIAAPLIKISTDTSDEARWIFFGTACAVFVVFTLALLYSKKNALKNEQYYRSRQKALFAEYYTVLGRVEADTYFPVQYVSYPLLNAIINRKVEICQGKKIRVQIDMSQFDGGYVENIDWMCIFMNLFDNGVENCMELARGRERFVRMKVKSAGGFEVVVFQSAKTPEKENFSYEFTRNLHIIEEVAQKYGGSVLLKEGENTFQTTVSLQVREKGQENAV